MPKISTIIPVYNVEQYIEQAIDSVLNQTLNDIEIILVDDGSTDNSGLILDEYAEKYPNCHVYHQENQGQAVARNNALKHATGEYITFLDADDYIPLDAYEKLYNTITQEGTDLIVGDCLRFNNETTFKSNLYNQVFPENFQEIPSTHIKEYKNLVYDTGIWRLVKKSFLDKYNLKFAEGLFYEDILFSIQLHYLADSVSLIPDVVYYWRSRNTGIDKSTTQSKAQIQNMRDRFIIANLIKEFQLEHKINDELIEEQYYKWLSNDFLLYVDIFGETTDEYQKELLKNINTLLPNIPDKVFDRLKNIDKLKYDLIRKNDIQGLLKLLEFEKTDFQVDAVFKGGRYIISTPCGELDITDDYDLVTDISSFKREGDNLLINGKLSLHYIQLNEIDIELNTRLINLDTNKELSLENTYNNNFFTIELPFTDIPSGDNRIFLEIKTPYLKKSSLLKTLHKNTQQIPQYHIQNNGITLSYTDHKTLSIYSTPTNLTLTQIQTHPQKNSIQLKFNTQIDKIILKNKHTKETLEYPSETPIPYENLLNQEWIIQYQKNNKLHDNILLKKAPYTTYNQKNKIILTTNQGKTYIKTKNESQNQIFLTHIEYNNQIINLIVLLPDNEPTNDIELELFSQKTKDTIREKPTKIINQEAQFQIPLYKQEQTHITRDRYIFKIIHTNSGTYSYIKPITTTQISNPEIRIYFSLNNNLKLKSHMPSTIKKIQWEKKQLKITLTIPEKLLNNTKIEDLEIQLTGDTTNNIITQKINNHTKNNKIITTDFLINPEKIELNPDTYLFTICSDKYNHVIKNYTENRFEENIIKNKVITPYISKNKNLKLSIVENSFKKSIKRYIKKIPIFFFI